MSITLKGIVDTTFEVAEALNPFTTKYDETMKSMTETLLDAGYSPGQVLDYIGVSTDDLQEHIAIEMEVRKRIAEMKQRTRTKKA